MFGKILKEKRKEMRLSLGALSQASGVSKTYINNIEEGKPHPITGADPRPTEDIIEKLAIALDWNINEALMNAGYAKKTQTTQDVLAEEIMGYLTRMEPRDRERVRQIVRTFAVA